jgi:hypothetical protein
MEEVLVQDRFDIAFREYDEGGDGDVDSHHFGLLES